MSLVIKGLFLRTTRQTRFRTPFSQRRPPNHLATSRLSRSQARSQAAWVLERTGSRNWPTVTVRRENPKVPNERPKTRWFPSAPWMRRTETLESFL